MFLNCNSNYSKTDAIYIGKNFSKNIDTIKLIPNGIYKRTIYNTEGKLIFKNEGTYKIKKNNIEFDDFLLNLNDLEYSSNLKYDSKDLTNAYLDYDTNIFGETKIIVDYDLDYYYIKL